MAENRAVDKYMVDLPYMIELELLVEDILEKVVAFVFAVFVVVVGFAVDVIVVDFVVDSVGLVVVLDFLA